MSNENRIYKNYYLTDRKYVDLSRVCGVKNVLGWKYTDQIACWPKKPYDGGKAVELKIGGIAVKEPRAVSIDAGGTDFSGCDTLSLAVNGITPCDLVTVALIDADGRKAEYTVNFFIDRWSRLLIDVSACDLLSRVARIDVTFTSEKGACYGDEYLYVGEIYFGNVVDFSFERGGFERYFAPQDCVKRGNACLEYAFGKGEALVFPRFERARYSVLNSLIGIKDHIKISARSVSGCRRFRLYFATDKHPEFLEERSAEVEFCGGEICSRLVKIDGLGCGEDERLCGIMLRPQGGEGRLDLYEVSLVQEKDFILDDNANEYLKRTPVRCRNPYPFKVPQKIYDVKTYGAKGNFYDNDTPAVQAAIDDAAAHGGGIVRLKEGRFVVSHLRLASDIELRIEATAMLVQSERPADYPYPVAYEHDNFYYNINWAHNFLVHNKPLLYADKVERVRICGGGKIRMADTGSEALTGGYPYYDIHCNALIHVLPIAFNHCRRVEINSITINRANSYHTFFGSCSEIFINKIKFFDPRCLSGDGIGISGTRNVLVANAFMVTNDDGVTLNPGYDDPRGHGWWQSTPGRDNTVTDIEIRDSYINSGYGAWGKAIAFIPWGKCAPNQEFAVTKNIYVHDCVLDGGHSVGTWCDDPFHGKQPYDGSELDDYSPVSDITFRRNTYLSKVDLMEIAVTNMVSDNGLKSAKRIVNGNFADGLSNWKASDGVACDRQANCVPLAAGQKLYQIICSEAGENRFAFELKGKGVLFVNGKRVPFAHAARAEAEIAAVFRGERNIKVGIVAEADTQVYAVKKK